MSGILFFFQQQTYRNTSNVNSHLQNDSLDKLLISYQRMKLNMVIGTSIITSLSSKTVLQRTVKNNEVDMLQVKRHARYRGAGFSANECAGLA